MLEKTTRHVCTKAVECCLPSEVILWFLQRSNQSQFQNSGRFQHSTLHLVLFSQIIPSSQFFLSWQHLTLSPRRCMRMLYHEGRGRVMTNEWYLVEKPTASWSYFWGIISFQFGVEGCGSRVPAWVLTSGGRCSIKCYVPWLIIEYRNGQGTEVEKVLGFSLSTISHWILILLGWECRWITMIEDWNRTMQRNHSQTEITLHVEF